MIKKLVLPLVGSETMGAKARKIAILIEDPDYVRRSTVDHLWMSM
jgi:hypothetical protein